MAMTMQHATNVLREAGAVVPAEEYRAVCAERDAATAEVARLTALVADRRPEIVTSGDLSVNLVTGVATRAGRPVALLSNVERCIVTRLAMHQGHPVPANELGAYVWGEIDGNDGGHRVRVNLSRIRTKLGDPAIKLGQLGSESRYFVVYATVGVMLR